jgi:hypothetical protein
MSVCGLLLLATFLEQFSPPRKAWWFTGLTLLLGIVWGVTTYRRINGEISAQYWNPVWQCWAALGMTGLAAGWAAWRRKPGAWLTLAACGLGLATVRMGWPLRLTLNGWFMITFVLLVLSLLVTISLRVQAVRRAARAAELTSARMEIELLKKNFQPHFLMNTLAVLSEVVEQSPPAAIKLIDDLAEEFRTVARVSAEKLIPLAQELDLCRAHLRVMSVRTGRDWQLEVREVDATALVPPAIFLTLIENGFAHQRPTEGATTFVLSGETAGDGVRRYSFVSPGEIQAQPGRPVGGTGMRYVQARLEESFSGRWSLRGQSIPQGWVTIIEISPAKKGALT